ncbi:MAG TPA: MATE family efflux transporter [Trueperaceae bacterium]
MLSRRFDREIFALALPALGTLAADPLVSLVDTAFVGRLGTVELGALGVNSALFALAFFVFNFLAYGTTPMVARANARGDAAAAGRRIVQALFLAALLGLATLLLVQLLAKPALVAMGADRLLLEPALAYLRVRALAIPAVLLILAANGAYRGFQDTRTPFLVTLVLNLVNLALDPIFIFVLDWGIAGAAWATVIGQWLGALSFLWLLAGRDRSKLGPVIAVPRLAELRPFLRIGWELVVRTFVLVLTLALATAVAARLGVVEVATHQVAVQIWLFLSLVIDALAIAAQALVARYLGEGVGADARALSNRLLLLGLFLGAVLGVILWAARHLLARTFSEDPQVVAGVLAIFPFVALMQPLNALVFVWDGIFMGMEDFRYLAWAMIASAAVGSLLLILVIPLGWGLAGVWWAIVGLSLARLLSLALRYWRPNSTRVPV